MTPLYDAYTIWFAYVLTVLTQCIYLLDRIHAPGTSIIKSLYHSSSFGNVYVYTNLRITFLLSFYLVIRVYNRTRCFLTSIYIIIFRRFKLDFKAR